MRSAAGGGRKAVVAGATGEGAWGGGWGARGAPPPPAPANPTSRDVAGRSGREEGHRPHTRTRTQPGRRRRHRVAGGGARPPGAGEEWRARRGGPAGQGRAGRGGKAAEEESRLSQTRPPKLCTRRPNNPSRAAPHPPEPHTRAGHPPDPTTRGGAPSGRGGGRGSLPLSPFPSHPAPHGWRRGSRAGRGKATTPLSEPTTLMILPQVHLRKPCYDFYFL